MSHQERNRHQLQILISSSLIYETNSSPSPQNMITIKVCSKPQRALSSVHILGTSPLCSLVRISTTYLWTLSFSYATCTFLSLLIFSLPTLPLGTSLVAQRLKHCLECRRPGFDPWLGKIPWRRKWQPTPVLLPGESHGGRSLVGYSLWGRKESEHNWATSLTHSPYH